MTERQRMIEGKLYNPYKVEGNEWEKSRVVLEQFNQMPYQLAKERMALLKVILGAMENDAYVIRYRLH